MATNFFTNHKPKRMLRNILAGLAILMVAFPASAGAYPRDVSAATPRILASITHYWFEVDNFSPGGALTIKIYDSLGGTLLWEATRIADGSGNAFVGEWEHPVNFVPGTYIHITDGTIIKGLVLEDVTLDVFDPAADYLAGTAPPEAGGRSVWVGTGNESSSCDMWVLADPVTGAWEADFSATCDVTEDMWGAAQIFDVNEDATEANPPPDPHFVVFPEGEWFDGLNWPNGATVTITVAGKPECTREKESWRYFFNGGFPEGCDLVAGDVVTFTDGVTVRTHTVRNLAVTVIDKTADTVAGTADEGETVRVWPHEDGSVVQEVTVGPSGTWQVDFTGQFDLVEGTDGRSEILDGEGNATAVDWVIPNPHFIVFPEWEWFDGLDWPDGVPVAISVKSKPECSTTGTSSGSFFNGGFPAGCDVEPGDIVTFTDGVTVRTHTVRNLAVTGVNRIADTVTGTADEGETVHVWPHEDGSVVQEVTVGPSGTWQVDFTGQFDLVEGTDGRSEIRDEEGNATAVDWLVPNPHFVVFPEWEWFDGLDWPHGATVTITVAGKPVCTTSKVSSAFFFNGPFPAGCDLEIGDTVTFTDGSTIRTHTVRNLRVTKVDIHAETVSGKAYAGAVVHVWPHDSGIEEVEVIASTNGNWTADFSGSFDIIENVAGRSEIRDEVGNATAVDWWVPFKIFMPLIRHNAGT